MIDLIFRGLFSGTFTVTAAQAAPADYSPIAGFAIFTLGILVGLAGAVMADRRERNAMRVEYERWVADGKPERRTGERRGPEYRGA